MARRKPDPSRLLASALTDVREGRQRERDLRRLLRQRQADNGLLREAKYEARAALATAQGLADRLRRRVRAADDAALKLMAENARLTARAEEA